MAATMAASSVCGAAAAGFAADAAAGLWGRWAVGKMPARRCNTLGNKAMATLMSVRAVKTIAIPVIDKATPWKSMTFCQSKLNVRKMKSSCDRKWAYKIRLKRHFYNGFTPI